MQSKALDLIEWSQWFLANVREKRDFRWQHMQECQDELRRLHALNQELLEALEFCASTSYITYANEAAQEALEKAKGGQQ